MSLPSSIRATPVRASLQSILKYLRDQNVESAAKTLRHLIDEHNVPQSALTAGKRESPDTSNPAISVASFGARLSLDRSDFESAKDFARLLNTYSGSSTNSISPTITHVLHGLHEVSTPSSLSYAIELLLALPASNIPGDVLRRFYTTTLYEDVDQVLSLWEHTRDSHPTLSPSGQLLLLILKNNKSKANWGDNIYIITWILKHNPSDSLPHQIPLSLAPEVIALAAKSGATQQSLQLWSLARDAVGPLSPDAEPTMDQVMFFGSSTMTYALVRHLAKLAAKPREQLKGWHEFKLRHDRYYYDRWAGRVYRAFATAHGFDLPGEAGSLARARADHQQLTTSIACLFALHWYEAAIEAFESLITRDEPPDNYDLGIVLAAYARHRPGRAVQMLLEAAPNRIKGFAPTPHLYNIVMDQCNRNKRDDLALRVLQHAREAGHGSLQPMTLDSMMRNATREIRASWLKNASDEKVARERYYLFRRILDVMDSAQHHTRESSVRRAIELALEMRQAIIAWELYTKAKKHRVLGWNRRQMDNDESSESGGLRDHQRLDRGPSSAWNVAKALWSTKERGMLTEQKMWQMIDRLGVSVPEEVRLNGLWPELPGEEVEAGSLVNREHETDRE